MSVCKNVRTCVDMCSEGDGQLANRWFPQLLSEPTSRWKFQPPHSRGRTGSDVHGGLIQGPTGRPGTYLHPGDCPDHTYHVCRQFLRPEGFGPPGKGPWQWEKWVETVLKEPASMRRTQSKAHLRPREQNMTAIELWPRVCLEPIHWTPALPSLSKLRELC